MDAHAHLKGLGWRGTGHSLDKTDRGLKKPLLISHKYNLHGLGSKSQKEKQADQWWLNAFDNALKDIGTGKQSALASVHEHGVNRGGLYGYFVKGQVLESTIENSTVSATPSASTPPEPSVSSLVPTDLDDNDSTSSATSIKSGSSTSPETSTAAVNMGPRRNCRVKRNTNLANGANSMPLGTNRLLAAQNEDDKKRKRSEEPAEASSSKPKKKAKGINGEDLKPTRKEKVKKEVTAPEKSSLEEKGKKSAKSKKSAEGEVLVKPVTKDKTKKPKREDKGGVAINVTAETTAAQDPVRKSKKGRKELVVESEVESLIDSEIDSEIDSDSDSEDNLVSELETKSEIDSDEDSGDDSEDDSKDGSEDDSVEESDEATSPSDDIQGKDAYRAPINVLKVVDGIPIPAPDIVIKEKIKKLPARVVREKRKMERKEKARQIVMESKERAIAEGTFDFEADERKQKERAIDRKVKHELRRRENAGEFGPVLPHPTELLKFEKEIARELKKTGQLGDPEIEKRMMHEKLISIGVIGLNQNRTVKYKEEKYKREKLKREVARDIKARERARVFGEEYVREQTLSEHDLKKKKAEEKEKAKLERREARAQKALQNEEKEAEKLKRKEEKKMRREQKKENQRKTAEGIAALKAQKAAEAPSLGAKDGDTDMFARGADEIKLGINIDGRTRTVPGVGQVSRYPTKAEKLRTKIEARAYEAGITYEEMKARFDKEKEEEMAPEVERVTQVRTARGGLTSKQWHHYCVLAQLESQEEAEQFFLRTKKMNDEKAAAIANGTANGHTSSGGISEGDVKMRDAPNGVFANKPLSLSKPLSEKKKRKYATKATEKGMSLDDYIVHHEAKKARKTARRESGADTVAVQSTTALTNGKSKADLLLAAAKSTVSSNGVGEELASAFVIDTAGDSDLKDAHALTEPLGFVVDTSGDPEILERPKPTLIWHPDMLGDRKVKELSKEERKARLEYMRERRAARHAAAGKTPASKKERQKLRIEKKQKTRNKLVAQIMTEKGVPKEQVSKEELEVARRAAKRAMREDKRIKRDKVIHRKKLGGGLRGQFGGSISVGGRT